jgi:hypothetical protein
MAIRTDVDQRAKEVETLDWLVGLDTVRTNLGICTVHL